MAAGTLPAVEPGFPPVRQA